MMDAAYLGLVTVLFLSALGLVRLAERL